MSAHFFAFVTRGPDGRFRATFPDLPALVVPAARASEIELAAARALAVHMRERTTPLPEPLALDALRHLFPPDDGFWLAVPVLDAVVAKRRP